MGLVMRTCASFAFKFKDDRSEYCTRSTRNARPFCWWGGDKTGDDRWYEVNVPSADRLYDEHLEELKEETKKEAAEDG